jgi:adenylate cyclase
MGQTGKKRELLDRSFREAMECDLDVAAGSALNNIIAMLIETLRARECQPLIEKLRALPHGLASRKALYWDGGVKLCLGSLDEASATLREVVESAGFAGANQRSARMGLAWALSELGQVPFARDAEAEPDPDADSHTLAYEAIAWAKYQLAAGTPERALPVIERVLGLADGLLSSTHSFLELPDRAVAVLIATGQVAHAARVASEVEAAGMTRSPWAKRACARVRLCEGRSGAARELLADVAAEFADAEYCPEEIETRLLLADASIELDDADGAIIELRRAHQRAQECRAWRMARIARETLLEMGSDVECAEPTSDQHAPPSGLGSISSEPDDTAPGERMVSVFFADVRGYTAMATRTSPEELANRIASLQRWARHTVERHRGVVDKFAGDAVMATFNVSDTRVDHCLDALQAAIVLRDKAALIDLPLGIGIAAGPAIVGHLTSSANLSVLGEATNLASRLQAEAGEDEVVLSEEAYRRVLSWVEQRRLPVTSRTISVKGLAQPVTAFVLRRQCARSPDREDVILGP